MDLSQIERYYDAVPRPVATVEEVGPFTLFVADPATGWQFYARPRLGLDRDVRPDDVRRVLARQAELGVPGAVEWVDDTTPSLLPAVRAAVGGPHQLDLCPLLVLPRPADLRATTGATRVLAADDPDLPLALGVASAAFGGRDEVTPQDPGVRRRLVERGLLVVVAAYDGSGTLVATGTAAPREDTAELMGIATLPGARRRGLGSAVTAALVRACREAGVHDVFLTAASDEAASVYRSLGFERRALACILGAGS
ncbi:GNAT family N-acetyltransferase [Nocardioides sp. MAHUQ-72]|uniref:GNAT family N-acetyltransferase n=1 Tax=unclassified Nocardioides TaxID=2615069 RepID=UPI003612D30E